MTRPARWAAFLLVLVVALALLGLAWAADTEGRISRLETDVSLLRE